jgi:hypothetical protein
MGSVAGVLSSTMRAQIRLRGAASIAMGVTPHEVRDELCQLSR